MCFALRDLSRPVAVIVLLSSTACIGGNTTAALEPRDPTELTFHASLGVDLDEMTLSESGLYFQTLQEGVGADIAAAGDVADVRYTGWLHNGTEFDSNEGDASPLQRTLGVGQLIPGFDQGVQGMSLEETRLLVIPYQLGYGGANLGVIPPFSTLVFRVTLVALEKAGP